MDLESLMMVGKLSILVIGQDVLRTNSELAGILLDTQNLNASAKLSMARNAEAVQLLLVGLAPNYRNALFDQLMQDGRDKSFYETLLHNYGKRPNESYDNGEKMERKMPARKSLFIPHHEATAQHSEWNSNNMKNAKTNRASPNSGKPAILATHAPAATPDNSRRRNKFFLAKWFGFVK